VIAALSRGLAAALLAGATAALVASAAHRAPQLLSEASLAPRDHPWVRLDREITTQFGFENPVVWVIAARDGTVWSTEHLRQVQEITRAAMRIPGVIATDVISLASPNLRDLEVGDFGLRPVYLMAEVPSDPEALETLRRRVETDPNYRGTLMSADGRAAMVVANFRAAADARVISSAARALREAHQDARTAVHVAGAALMRTMTPDFELWAPLAAAWLAGVGLLVAGLGARDALACILAKLLAAVWTGAGLVAAGLGQVPWTAYAIPYGAALAAVWAVVSDALPPWRRRVAITAALAGGFAPMGVFLEGPARAFAVACAAASVLAVLASIASTALIAWGLGAPAGRRAPPLHRQGPRLRLIVLAVACIAALGVPWLDISLGLAGYGERYLPGAESADLRAIARYFPPPTSLAVRVRGEPRFVASPAVLRAFDGVVAAARSDPAVVNAMSLADLVKLVHRGFNEGDPAFGVIPEDEALIARYLTLAYSPGFRRFVDRAQATAVVWVYLGSDRPADLERVLGRIQTQLEEHPIPEAHVDLIGGDGAGILLMSAIARSLPVSAAAWLASASVLLALFCGAGTALRAAAGGVLAAAVAAGSCGWLGIPLDLLSLPLLIGMGAAATGLAAIGGAAEAARLRYLGIPLGVVALSALATAYTGAQLFGCWLLALAVVAGAIPGALGRKAAVPGSRLPATHPFALYGPPR
jgi:hypothetical protein